MNNPVCSPTLFQQLHDAVADLAIDFAKLQRVRLLMRACQIPMLPAAGRRLEWQPSGLIVTGTFDEGMLVVLDHPVAAGDGEEPRVCRVCACTSTRACLHMGQPCSWRVTYDDNTGLCSHCDDTGPQLTLITHNAGDVGKEHSHG